MNGLLASMLGAVSQGLIWSMMVLGVYITFKLLNIADMTTDGAFALGGCVCATMMLAGLDPTLALICGSLAGGVAGAVTGVLHTFFGIPAILAGILTQISLWSINLRIMSDKSNQSVNKIASDITFWVDKLGITQSQATLIVGLIVAIALIAILYWFFGTELGAALRATGNNEDMIRALGVDTNHAKLLGLVIANVLCGLSGALVCQSTKYADVGMGTGAIVIGLASIVIGEVIFAHARNFAMRLSSAVIGCVIYFVIRAVVLRLGMKANDMKLLSAVIVALALCIPVAMQKYRAAKSYRERVSEDEEATDGEKRKLGKAERRSLMFLLASIVLWYMGYNAVTSKYSVYASSILNKDYNLTLIIAQAAAIISYLPVGIISSKLGRKKTILAGIVMLSTSFLIACFLRESSPTLLMNCMFALAGIGWATINVNSFPMVVEMCSGGEDVGKYTGIYYTASMAAQTVTPMFSGYLMDQFGMTTLFPYAAIFAGASFVTMLFVMHGDNKPSAKRGLEALDVED